MSEHAWTTLPRINDEQLDIVIENLKAKTLTPKNLFVLLFLSKLYVSAEQFKKIQSDCTSVYHYSNGDNPWYLFEHALCARVTDRWNLREKYGAEGYYYISLKTANTVQIPPNGWNPHFRLDVSIF